VYFIVRYFYSEINLSIKFPYLDRRQNTSFARTVRWQYTTVPFTVEMTAIYEI